MSTYERTTMNEKCRDNEYTPPEAIQEFRRKVRNVAWVDGTLVGSMLDADIIVNTELGYLDMDTRLCQIEDLGGRVTAVDNQHYGMLRLHIDLD